MIRWIVGSSVRYRRVVIGIAVVALLGGLWSATQLQVEAMPEIAPPTVEVQTEALGLSALEVEQLITVPLEQDLLVGVAWLDEIRSKSVPGLSSIQMVFEPGTDLMRARQVVQERLSQAAGLPNVSKPPAMLQPLSSTSRVMMMSLSSDELTPIEMGVLARWVIRPRLMGVPGVANVAMWGQRERQLQVLVDPERLAEKDVTLDQVIETTGNALWVSPLTFLEASTPGTGGFIDAANQRIGVQHFSPIKTAEDLAKVTIEGAADQGLLLADVAEVVEDHQPLIGDAVVDDGPGFMLVVEKFPDASTEEVTAAVDAALEELQPGLGGVAIDSTIYRPDEYVDRATDSLRTLVLVGGILGLLGLLGLLLDWRTTLISVAAIALSLAGALLVLWATDTTANTVVLAGIVLAVAVVVDEAVVGLGHVGRRLRGARQADEAGDGPAVVAEATIDVRRPMAYATVVIALVAAPILFMNGLPSQEFLEPATGSYLLAVVVAMLVAHTVTPALSASLLGNLAREPRESALAHRLQQGYGRLGDPVARRPLFAAIGCAAAVLLGLLIVPQLDKSLIPRFEERDLVVRFDGAPGTSLPEMSRVAARATAELRALPGIDNVGAHVGRAITGDQVTGSNSAELWVSLDQSADYDDTVADVREVIGGYAGLDHSVLTYTEARTNELLRGIGDPVAVRIYGQDLEVLRMKAEEVRQILSGIDGVVDAHVEAQIEEPAITIEVDLDAAQEAGIKPGEVRRAAAALLQGIDVGSLFEEQKVFDVVVRGAPAIRQNLTSVEELMIDLPAGGQVPLADVAKVSIASTPNIVEHEDVSRSIDIGAAVSGRDRAAVERELREQLAAVEFPLEHHAEVLAAYGERQDAKWHLWQLGIAAAIGIFLILQAAFESWRLAVVLFVTAPTALLGGLVIALVNGQELSTGVVLALLVVLGVSVRQGLALASRARELEESGQPPGDASAAMRAASERVGPIVLTTVVTTLALSPVLFLGDRPGFEIIGPMAPVVMGGLVMAAVANLFLLPALYQRFGHRKTAELVGIAEVAEAERSPEASLSQSASS